MKVSFDATRKVAGIGIVPWTRLGPERWFANYKIASLYGLDVAVEGAPQVIAMNALSEVVNLPRLNTQSMLNNQTFRDLLIQNFSDSDFLTYKPIEVPEELQAHGMRFLENDQQLAKKLENKAYFRTHFSPLGIPFPEYTIYEDHSLEPTAEALEKLLAGRDEVIVQDAALSGGKGTHTVRDMPTLTYAFDALRDLGSAGTLVVSEKINPAHERTVQCVATKYGVFVGPLQKQIVANPLLANMEVPNGDKFCGIEISRSDELLGTYPVIKQYAETIGKELLDMGYRGIFGVDCLVSEDGQVYVLEVNPRITGATPLVTMLYREGKDIPFYLLHLLELMGADYEITDPTIDPEYSEGSLLMFHAHNKTPAKVAQNLRSGLYDDSLTYIKEAMRLDEGSGRQVLVQRYISPDFTVKPGGRTLCVFVNFPTLDADGNLNNATSDLAKKIHREIIVEEV
ncbi:MAG TPA: ATP-grasp domain-containing protein [Candidatus Bathyarchaeia archaeon]|nr:ATP-grasp domain-containing protein [Candidatus Bathyarchaeia archaeon]